MAPETQTGGPGLKRVLAVGLKSNATFDEEAIRRFLAASTAQAREAGFDLRQFMIDPAAEAGPAAAQLEAELLRGQKEEGEGEGGECWHGVVVGFGVRGEPALTPLFEDIVNTCARVLGGRARFAFNTSPQSTVEAMVRALS